MAQKTNKANFNLQVASKEARVFPTISLTTGDEGTESPEDAEVSQNPEASARLRALSEQGLNPLKPVIIANTEFVPVGSGESPDSTGLKAQLGENNLLSVNSVTKLFEIHRQIRLATINSAEYLLNRIKGYDSKEILEELSRLIKNSIDDLASDSLEATVEAVIERMSNFQTPGKSKQKSKNKSNRRRSSATRDNQKGRRAQRKPEDDPRSVSNSGLSTSSRVEIKQIIKDNSSDPYLRTLVEYAILEHIVFDMIKYLSGILALKDAAAKSWSVLESLSYNSMNSISDSSFNSSGRKLLEEATRSFTVPESVQEVIGSAAEVLANFTGIKTTAVTPDITLLLQLFIENAESLIRMRSNYNDVVSDNVSNPFYTGKIPNLNQGNPQVYNALKTLSEGYASTLYAYMEIAGENFDDDFDNSLLPEISEYAFTKSRVDDIFDDLPGMSKTDALGQMLGAIILNDCFHIAGKNTALSRKVSAFNAMGQGTPTSLQNVEGYFRELVGYSKSEEHSYFEYSLKEGSKQNQEKLVKYLYPKSSNSEDLSDYIPFESNSSLSKEIYFGSYLTGPEYFYDIALQRNDVNLRELKKFAESYQNFATSYASDIYNLTKIDYAEEALRRLFAQIGDELSSAAVSGNSVLLLALIANQAGSNKGLLRLFRSVYFASRLTSKDNKEGKNIGKGSVSPFKAGEDATAKQGSRRVMRAANTILLRTLLKDSFGISSSNIKTKAKKSVLDLDGDQQAGALKPKEYTEKDADFSNIKDGVTLNTGTGTSINKKIKYTIHKQSGKNNDTPTGGLNKEEVALEGGANFSTRLCESIKYFLSNEHFVDVGLLTEEQKTTFNSERRDITRTITVVEESDDDLEVTSTGTNTSYASGDVTEGVNFQGTGVKLADHHRAFVLYSFIAKIIRASLKVRAKSFNTKDSNDAKIEITINADEVEGIAQAFKDAGNDTVTSSVGWSESKIIARDNTREHLLKLVESLQRRVRKISMLSIAPALHSLQIYNQYLAASKFIKQGSGTARDQLAISVLKSDKIKAFDKTLTLLTDESVGKMYKSYVTSLSRSNNSYTREDVPNLQQMKLMMKILTHPGYGLLSSEKRGPKNICHVGVTNSLLDTLRTEAYKEFNNRNFLESTRFCVNIFKRNEIDSQILVYPKTFLFDSSVMILDSDHDGRNLNHISNFSDTWTFDQILDNIEFTSWANKAFSEENPFSNLKKAYSAERYLGKDIKSKFGAELLTNHVLDYAFKVYYRYALGIDFNENTFTLSPIRNRSDKLTGGISVPNSDIQEDYNNLINQTRLLYPAANVDQKLASELFRAIEIIAAHPGYCLTDKVRKTIYPKKFDNVLSILVNEKDFILYTDAYDKNFIDVYKTEPSFSYTSKTTRPDTNLISSENEVTVNKYIAECDEDFPEIFSMYATITILPEGTK